LYGAFVWARGALSSQKRRFPAVDWALRFFLPGGMLVFASLVCLLTRVPTHKVRKTPSWPRSWANVSLF
jgi:hypothetical protein